VNITITIDIACNNYRNGSFQGYANDISISLPDGESVELNGGYTRIAFPQPNLVRIAGVSASTVRQRSWPGNWCWESVVVSAADALRILNKLKARRWSVQCAPEAFFDRWELEAGISAEEWAVFLGDVPPDCVCDSGDYRLCKTPCPGAIVGGSD